MPVTVRPNGLTIPSGVWWLITTFIAVALILGLGTLEVLRMIALALSSRLLAEVP